MFQKILENPLRPKIIIVTYTFNVIAEGAEAIQCNRKYEDSGLLRRAAPRNDVTRVQMRKS